MKVYNTIKASYNPNYTPKFPQNLDLCMRSDKNPNSELLPEELHKINVPNKSQVKIIHELKHKHRSP